MSQGQRNLVVALRCWGLRSDPMGPGTALFLSAEELAPWLAKGRAVFPGASAQELVSLALAPESFQDEIERVIQRTKPGAELTRLGACLAPDFDFLGESTALCSIQVKAADLGSGAGGKNSRRERDERDREIAGLFEERVRLLFPGAILLAPETLKLEPQRMAQSAEAQWERAALGKVAEAGAGRAPVGRRV